MRKRADNCPGDWNLDRILTTSPAILSSDYRLSSLFENSYKRSFTWTDLIREQLSRWPPIVYNMNNELNNCSNSNILKYVTYLRDYSIIYLY